MTVPVGPERFVAGLRRAGIGQVASVPCSYFAAVLRHLDQEAALPHLATANEGSALAFAAGSWLGGKMAAVLAQNSGFGNLINPLTSLLLPYRIPALVFVSMRGYPAPERGEPQHEWMGRAVPGWLESLGVPNWLLAPSQDVTFDDVLACARTALAQRQPAFVLVGSGALAQARPRTSAEQAALVTRRQLIAALAQERADEFIVSTTGYLSREFFNAGDRPSNFYMQGSMGHAAAIALGASLARPDRRLVVLDGDGAMLMHLGSAATVAHSAPGNLLHIVFCNGGYESTGGQPLGADGVDFAAVALSLGYRRASVVDSASELRKALRDLLDGPAPAMLVVRGTPSDQPAGRASETISLGDIATRFAAALRGAP